MKYVIIGSGQIGTALARIVAVSQRTSRNWEWKTPQSSAF